MANTNILVDTDLLNFYNEQQIVPLKKKVDSMNADSVNAIPKDQKGANDGVATLDAKGKVPTTQLPEALYAFDVSAESSSSWTDGTTTVNGVKYTNPVHITKTTKTLTLKDKTTASDTEVDVLTNVVLNVPVATNGRFGVASYDSNTLTVESGVVKVSDAVLDRITALETALNATPDGDEVEY